MKTLRIGNVFRNLERHNYIEIYDNKIQFGVSIVKLRCREEKEYYEKELVKFLSNDDTYCEVKPFMIVGVFKREYHILPDHDKRHVKYVVLEECDINELDDVNFTLGVITPDRIPSKLREILEKLKTLGVSDKILDKVSDSIKQYGKDS